MQSKSPWWRSRNLGNGRQVGVGLIQFDLGGHSSWSADLEETGSRHDIFLSRKDLKVSLRQAVSGYGFSMHHWAGDGGLFAGLLQGPDDGDRTYEAMSQMLSAFERWRNQSSSRESLACRISATYIPDLCIDRDPGDWYSTELNLFLKYERQIGHVGTLRITQALRRQLNKRGCTNNCVTGNL
jgi:hypothetical protein